MIKCIIFDCDGTLVDSEYLCNLGLEIKLREYGIESSAKEMMLQFRGGKLATILQTIESDYNVKLKENFVSSYRSLVDKLFEKELRPCEGVNETLANLTLPKCVASSGPMEKINKVLSISGLSGHFNEKIFSSYDVGSWKPDPGIFLHAAKEMGFQPNECAVVEDSPLGISAAVSAGMRPILYNPNDTYYSTQYVHTIKHMRELHSAIT